MSTHKKILFNMNWDLDTNGVRKLELDALKGLNSNINAVSNTPSLIGSPIDGTTTKADITLFLVRKRMIQLIDIWNRILNSGLFLISKNPYDGRTYPETKLIGANIPHPLTEYLFKNNFPTTSTSLDFKTDFIFSNLIKFITACINNFNNFKTNTIGNQNFFDLIKYSAGYIAIKNFVNTNYNPDNANFISLMNELINIVKDLIDETKLANTLLFDFSNMDFGTLEGRTNILALDSYKSNYAALAKVETAYLNPEPKALAQEWIQGSSYNAKLLWPQFGTLITRNTENEVWSFRNVLVDTSDYDQFAVDPLMDPLLKKYQPKYIACSQVDMKKPLVFATQFIDWSNEMDKPYIMSYNGGTLVYIPDEIKDPATLNTLGEQPDAQLNLAANFWKIGTSNDLDPNYNPTDDIKLKSIPELHNLDKLDYLDNLTLYLKLN